MWNVKPGRSTFHAVFEATGELCALHPLPTAAGEHHTGHLEDTGSPRRAGLPSAEILTA